MKAANRHEAILRLISEHNIDTQEELVRRLNESGYAATQATVSRDIRALRLSKVTQDGVTRYTAQRLYGATEDRYIRVFKESVVSMEAAGNLIVIKTASGMAMTAATALDGMNRHEIAGCIAGDDTVFAAVKTGADAGAVIERIKKHIG